MKKREAQFGTLFRSWLRRNPMPTSAFELKQTTADYLPFSDVKDHQIDALLSAKNGQLLWKLPDDSRGIKCFDYFYFNQAAAWVVIKYPGSFEVIDIEVFLLEKERSTRKSLTHKRAQEISTMSVPLRGR